MAGSPGTRSRVGTLLVERAAPPPSSLCEPVTKFCKIGARESVALKATAPQRLAPQAAAGNAGACNVVTVPEPRAPDPVSVLGGTIQPWPGDSDFPEIQRHKPLRIEHTFDII